MIQLPVTAVAAEFTNLSFETSLIEWNVSDLASYPPMSVANILGGNLVV